MSRLALVVAGILGATLCFALGWAMSHSVDTPKREPMATPSGEPASIVLTSPSSLVVKDAGPSDPLLLIDLSKINVVPTASLKFDPPAPLNVPGQTKAPKR